MTTMVAIGENRSNRVSYDPEQALGAAGGRPVVIVLGMHRSGTSLLSNVLHFLGVDMADPTDHIGAKNPAGFWERPILVKLHDRILEAIGLPLHNPAHALPLPAGWWRRKEIQVLKREMLDFVSGSVDQSKNIWGFKDPRTCRLLPLWWEIFRDLDLRARYVCSVRSPGESAASMSEKNQVSRPLSVLQAELMWLGYNYDVIRYVGSTSPLLVDYNSWFRDPLGLAAVLMDRLELKPILSQGDLAQCVQGLVHSEYRNKVEGEANAHFELPVSGPFYDTLSRAAHIGRLPDASVMERHLLMLDFTFSSFAPVLNLVRELPKLQATNKELECRSRKAEAALDQLGVQHAILERERVRLRAEHAALDQERTINREEITKLKREVSRDKHKLEKAKHDSESLKKSKAELSRLRKENTLVRRELVEIREKQRRSYSKLFVQLSRPYAWSMRRLRRT